MAMCRVWVRDSVYGNGDGLMGERLVGDVTEREDKLRDSEEEVRSCPC
jgi:hypothetical protein